MFLVHCMQKYTEISHSKNEKNWIKPWKVIFVSVSVVSQNSKLRENWFKVSKLIFSRLKHSFHELNCSKLTKAIADTFSLLIMIIFSFFKAPNHFVLLLGSSFAFMLCNINSKLVLESETHPWYICQEEYQGLGKA